MGDFAINGGVEYTDTTFVSLDNAMSDASPMEMRFSNDGADWPEGWVLTGVVRHTGIEIPSGATELIAEQNGRLILRPTPTGMGPPAPRHPPGGRYGRRRSHKITS